MGKKAKRLRQVRKEFAEAMGRFWRRWDDLSAGTIDAIPGAEVTALRDLWRAGGFEPAPEPKPWDAEGLAEDLYRALAIDSGNTWARGSVLATLRTYQPPPAERQPWPGAGTIAQEVLEALRPWTDGDRLQEPDILKAIVDVLAHYKEPSGSLEPWPSTEKLAEEIRNKLLNLGPSYPGHEAAFMEGRRADHSLALSRSPEDMRSEILSVLSRYEAPCLPERLRKALEGCKRARLVWVDDGVMMASHVEKIMLAYSAGEPWPTREEVEAPLRKSIRELKTYVVRTCPGCGAPQGHEHRDNCPTEYTGVAGDECEAVAAKEVCGQLAERDMLKAEVERLSGGRDPVGTEDPMPDVEERLDALESGHRRMAEELKRLKRHVLTEEGLTPVRIPTHSTERAAPP